MEDLKIDDEKKERERERKREAISEFFKRKINRGTVGASDRDSTRKPQRDKESREHLVLDVDVQEGTFTPTKNKLTEPKKFSYVFFEREEKKLIFVFYLPAERNERRKVSS